MIWRMVRILIPDEIEKLLLKAVTDQFAAGLRGARPQHKQEQHQPSPLNTGSRQPPGGVTATACGGPQVPGS